MPPSLPDETQEFVAGVAREFCADARAFRPLELSNTVMRRALDCPAPAGHGGHRAMAAALWDLFMRGAMPGYRAHAMRDGTDRGVTLVYAPAGASPPLLAGALGRRVVPHPPVEIERLEEGAGSAGERRMRELAKEVVSPFGVGPDPSVP